MTISVGLVLPNNSTSEGDKGMPGAIFLEGVDTGGSEIILRAPGLALPAPAPSPGSCGLGATSAGTVGTEGLAASPISPTLGVTIVCLVSLGIPRNPVACAHCCFWASPGVISVLIFKPNA